MAATDRYRRVAANFRKWKMENPEASLKRQVGAFNAIADNEFESSRSVKKARPKKLIKRV